MKEKRVFYVLASDFYRAKRGEQRLTRAVLLTDMPDEDCRHVVAPDAKSALSEFGRYIKFERLIHQDFKRNREQETLRKVREHLVREAAN